MVEHIFLLDLFGAVRFEALRFVDDHQTGRLKRSAVHFSSLFDRFFKLVVGAARAKGSSRGECMVLGR